MNLHPINENSTTGTKYDNYRDLWLNFSQIDMLDEMKKILQQGLISKSLIIWNRHQTAFDLSATSILDILNSLPRPMIENMVFLGKFVPDCLSLMKDQRDLSRALELLSTWIVATTTSLESENKTVWPQIGIDFAQGMLDVLESQQNVNKDELGLNSVRIPLLIQAHKNQKVHIMKLLIDCYRFGTTLF